MVRELKPQLRRLETLGKPVVAAINGAALGGGLEIALAAHHRVAVDDSKVVLGFPEVQLGLLPGGGGVTRSRAHVRHRQRAAAAAAAGPAACGRPRRWRWAWSTRSSPTRDELVPAAKKWIAANPEAVQPWDVKGYKIPGGTPSNPKFAANLPAFPANLRKKIKGANYPAPHHIMAAAVEGAQVDFDTAIEIEGRYFVDLVTGQVAKNMIQAFFFDLQAVNGDRGRPEDIEPTPVKKVVVLGAGMMGAAIAYVCAKAGIEVVLKDVDQAAADKGKDYSVKLVEKGVARGKTTQEKGDALLVADHRRRPTPRAAAGADLVIEAVFEDPAVKAQVMAEIEPHLAPDALLGSNTSTLPITALAENVSRPADFIGLHFFTPGGQDAAAGDHQGREDRRRRASTARSTSPSRSARPRSSSTTRAASSPAASSARSSTRACRCSPRASPRRRSSRRPRRPATRRPVLQLSDELNLKLMRRIRNASKAAAEAEGGEWVAHPAEGVIDRMLDEFERPGKLEGAGFYEYADGKRTRLWPGLREAFPPVADPSSISLQGPRRSG